MKELTIEKSLKGRDLIGSFGKNILVGSELYRELTDLNASSLGFQLCGVFGQTTAIAAVYGMSGPETHEFTTRSAALLFSFFVTAPTWFSIFWGIPYGIYDRVRGNYKFSKDLFNYFRGDGASES